MATKHRQKFAVAFVLFVSCVIALSFGAYSVGYRINISPSVPTGLWKVEGAVEKNGYAVVAANEHHGYRLAVERGYLQNFMPMLKRIVATAGDVVSYDVEERAVTVNGAYILMTEIYSQDTEGKPLPSANFPVRLNKDEVWLSSEHIRGYDSRYFGAISQDILQGAKPVWLWN